MIFENQLPCHPEQGGFCRSEGSGRGDSRRCAKDAYPNWEHRDGVEIPRKERSGFRLAAQFLACPEQPSKTRLSNGPRKRLNLSVILPRGFHPFPSRTRKLSPAGPIVLHAKVCGR